MPEMDHDVITLGHGSGGILTNRLLHASVFEILSNDHLSTHHDGAVLALSGPTAFTTDSFVISPIFFPKSNIGELAVNGTVNDLAMCGASPKYLSLSFIIEEGLEMQAFWDIVLSINYACQQAGVKIVTGDTKVVERGKGDKIFINTAGVGIIHPQAQISTQHVKPGDQVIISGQIANHGIAIMSVREGLEFETDLISDTRPLNNLVIDLLDHFGGAMHWLRDPTRGGVASALNELAGEIKMGVSIDQKDLPVDGRVESACELLGLDPLYVANEGIFLAVVDPKSCEEILNKLRSFEEARHAMIIGEIVDDHAGQVVMNSSVGGKRIVHRQIGEQLPRIC